MDGVKRIDPVYGWEDWGIKNGRTERVDLKADRRTARE